MSDLLGNVLGGASGAAGGATANLDQIVSGLTNTIQNPSSSQSSKNEAMEQLEKLGQGGTEIANKISSLELPSLADVKVGNLAQVKVGGGGKESSASRSNSKGGDNKAQAEKLAPYKAALKDDSASEMAKDHAKKILTASGVDIGKI